MNFANAMAREGAIKETENGAMAYGTIGNGALLDLFSQIGALRPRSEDEIRNKFANAFAENPLLATKMMFYSGDIRQGGLGERRTFRICLKWMAERHPDIVIKNIELIPYFNRFDSWFELIGTKCESIMWRKVAETLTADVKAMKRSTPGHMIPISLLAKWMPSENASSKKTHQMAVRAARELHMSARVYRKMLTSLRKHINVVETAMSAGKWSEIDYAKVPSYAMHNYGHAFAKHDYERFNAFLNRVSRGEQKINASTLFPYDLVHKYLYGGYSSDKVVEAQWKALPNYLTKEVNAIVMADVSGSMYGRPMETSIGLATYFAQHNKGNYHNKYMTFTGDPHFINIREGDSLQNIVDYVRRTGVGYNTNLERAFDYILETALAWNVSPSEMPECLVVISDMEIDRYMRPGYHWDFVDVMKARFARHGYKMPKLVMWNVAARNDTYLSQSEDVIFLSGQSASTFKNLCQNLNGITAYEMMVQILNGKAYEKVRV